jgi:Co/Zn/Cd efflux system component
LLSLSADVLVSIGYLLYKFSSATVKWSIFDTCSSVGAIACLVGLLATAAGKGAAVRLVLLFGCLGGILFWYLTIGPPS